MKVIHINGAGSWGGNEQQMGDFIPELEKLGVENMIFGRPDSPLHHYCQENNIPFISAKDGKLSKKSNYRYLKEIVTKHKPDVLHLHSSNAVTLFMISDILFGLKTPTVQSKKGMGQSMSFLSKIKYNYRNIDKIICVSEATKVSMENEVIKKRNSDKLIVIYDGINFERLNSNSEEDLRSHYNIIEEKFLIGNIANHTAAKDLPTLLKMMHHLIYVFDFKNFHLMQIGEYSWMTEGLKSLAAELKLEDYITFTDFKKNANSFLSQFDLYVMCSEREGLPLTVYEAFYKRVAVVSTKAGGIPEVIVDAENGFLAEVGEFKTLAEKIKLLLESPQLLSQFSEKSFNLVIEKYSTTQTAKNTLEVYKNVLTESTEFY